MAFGLNRLKNWVRRVKESLPGEANRITKRIAIQMLEELVYGTPVDTSKALSNWQVGIDSTPLDVIDPYFPGESGSTQSESADAAIAVGTPTINGRVSGQEIIIVNNVSYLDKIRDGTSTGQPGGMIERAIAIGEAAERTEEVRLPNA